MLRRPLPAALLVALLAALAAACVPAQPVPVASLGGSRRLVTVSYPTRQTLRATAGGRDTVLEGVSDVVGWPTSVRGDTLSLQLSRWRADGRTREMETADFVILVPPDAGATVREGADLGGGFPLGVVGAVALLLVGAGLVVFVLSDW